MANEKIINLDNLKKFRQEYDTRIKGGAIDVGRALVAKQIENISEDTGSTQTNPFLFQGTGTNDNTTETPTAPVAKHLELRGNTVKWNQLVNGLILSPSYTLNGITLTQDSQNLYKFTVSGTAEDTGYINMVAIKVVEGHKYLLKTGFGEVTTQTSYVRISGALSISGEGIATATASDDAYLRVVYSQGDEPTFSFYTNLIDLTDIYGVGKEPISYLQFVRDYPLPYYVYNAGELKSCSSSELITTGQNQWDEEWEIGSIDLTTGENVASSNYFRSKNYCELVNGSTYYRCANENIRVFFYDKNKNFISYLYGDKNDTFIAPYNAKYFRICPSTEHATYNNDIMICLYWGSGEDYSYKSYIKHEYDLPREELRSAGSTYDAITPYGVYTRRIGIVDLGTLSYANADSNGWTRAVADSLPTAKPTESIISIPNILCSRFIINSPDYVYSNDETISLDTTSRVVIRSTAFVGKSGSEISTLLSGVMLYFELETPIVSEVSAFAENIEVDDMGTMEFVPSDDNTDPIVPQGNKFFYPADYVLFIDDLYNRSKDGGDVADVGNFVTQSELQTATSNIPTQWYGTQAQYDALGTYDSNTIYNILES